MFIFLSITVICLTLIIITFINHNKTDNTHVIKKHELSDKESKSLGYDYIEIHKLANKELKLVYWNYESPVDNI